MMQTPSQQAHPKRTVQDLRNDLDKLEKAIAQLKMEYEQYFTGLLPLAPEKLHYHVKRAIRDLRKAPFRNNAINFRLKTLEGRYNTFNSYWQRVLKEREEGKYSRDVFKANIRERFALEDAKEQTSAGKAERGMQALFQTYKSALEKQSGRQQELDFKGFQKSLIERAKQLKKEGKKVTFKVTVENGKVSVKARVQK